MRVHPANLCWVVCLSLAVPFVVGWSDATLRDARIARDRMVQIWGAANNYLNDTGVLPADPHVLFPGYISDPRVFHHPGDPDPPPTTIDNSVPNAPNSAQISFDFLWIGWTEDQLWPDRLVVRDNSPVNNGGKFTNTLAADGLIETDPPLATPDPPVEYIAQHNMHRLFWGMILYSNDNEEWFPESLQQLWDGGYVHSPRTFWHPGDSDPPPTDITNDVPNAANSARISFDYMNPVRWAQASIYQIILQDNDPANNGGDFISKVSMVSTEVEPPLAARTPTAFQTGQMNLRRIALALRQYADENEDWLPASIEEVWTNGYVDDPFYFWNPGDSDPRPTDITNATPNATDSAAISFAYAYEGNRPVRLLDERDELVRDNSPANNRGLGTNTARAWRGLIGSVNARRSAWHPDCPGDVDGDNRVWLPDLAILLTNYGVRYVANPWDGDINADSHVTAWDLQVLLDHFGQACPDDP